MKAICTAFLLTCGLFCFGQRVPINFYTYENCTAIDNYFGETDSLLLQHNIHSLTIIHKTDVDIVYFRESYAEGKKLKTEEFSSKTGALERAISYIYAPNVLEAIITHYPSADNYTRWPAPHYSYLVRSIGNENFRPYKSDTATRIVRMRIRHTFNADGTVSFAGFNMDEKLIDTFTLTPDLARIQEPTQTCLSTNSEK